MLNNPKDKASRFWSILCLGVALWAFFASISFTTSDSALSLLFNRIANVVVGFIPVLFIGFTSSLSKKSPSKNLVYQFAWIIPVLCLIFIQHPIFIPSVEPKAGLSNYPNAGFLFHLFALNFSFCVVYGEWLLWKHLQKGDVSESQKMSGMLILGGTSIGFLLGGTAFLTVYNVPIAPYPSCLVWLFALFGTIAIARYNLFGIQMSPKEIPYFLVVTTSTILYLSASFLFAQFINQILKFDHPLHQFVTFLLCGLLLRPLQSAFEHTISYLLFKSTAKQLRALNHNLFERIEKDRRLSETSLLAAGMAHEIKNPLTTLKTFAEYLPDRYNDPDFIQRCSRIIQEETDRINNIVLQILEFASPSAIEPTNVDLHNLVEETLSMLSINLVGRSINAVNDVPKDLSICLDRKRFRQVLVNLFLNAIDACKNGGSIIIRSASSRRGFKNGVEISITDTGIGMSEEELTHLYDPFYSHNKENGTGLGMNIVKRIIDDHRGDIRVESKPNEGTTFTIFIPHSNST